MEPDPYLVRHGAFRSWRYTSYQQTILYYVYISVECIHASESRCSRSADVTNRNGHFKTT